MNIGRCIVFGMALLLYASVSVVSVAQSSSNVKKYKIKTSTVITKSNEDGEVVVKKKVSVFDLNGNLIEEQFYKGTQLEKKELYKYNKNNDETEHAIYNGDGSLKKKTVTKYDAFNKRIEEAVYNSSGALTDKIVITYNSFGEKNTEILYDGKGQIVEKIVYTYDSKGLVKDKTTYDAKGTVLSVKTYTYTF